MCLNRVYFLKKRIFNWISIYKVYNFTINGHNFFRRCYFMIVTDEIPNKCQQILSKQLANFLWDLEMRIIYLFNRDLTTKGTGLNSKQYI